MRLMLLRKAGRPFSLAIPALVSVGCAAQPVNPSFSITIDSADKELDRISAHRRRLDRPLVIISGLLDPGFAAWALTHQFESLFDDPRIIPVSIGEKTSIEACRRKVIEAVRSRLNMTGGEQTPEVDVIGFSLGGVVARYAALRDAGHQPRLNIVRLFTISSPNSGSERAQTWPILHPIQRDLRSGSPIMVKVNAQKADYEIIPYIRLGDSVIGSKYAAPVGRSAWWVSTPPLSDPHNGAYGDPRILADIARRLRDEPSLASFPPSPYPAER